MDRSRCFCLRVAAMLLVAAVSTGVGAAKYVPKSEEKPWGQLSSAEKKEKVWEHRFAGFEGIVFYCVYDPEKSLLAEICERAETEVDLIAASNDVPLIIVEPNNHFQSGVQTARNPSYVTLEYSLRAVEDSGQRLAVSGHLQFNTSYSNAVEQDAGREDFDAKPRPGTLVIWEDSVIGVGSRSGFLDTFSNAAEQLLKRAFTLMLKYGDPGEAQ